MSEFMFRAWDRRDKRILPNVYDNEAIFAHHKDGNLDVMQYTGLLDKNGTKIFEGDILSCTIRGKNRVLPGEVQRHKSGAWIVGEGGDLWHMNERCEVIGNIYENPDLLK